MTSAGGAVLKSLYIASTQGSGGKTTIAVGLSMALRHRGLKVGYFKPVGTLPARPTAAWSTRTPPSSPACSVSTTTRPTSARSCSTRRPCTTCWWAPRSTPCSRVEEAYRRIAEGRDIVVCEGLGEIWQGRFLHTSGMDVVRHLELKTLLVAKFAGARMLDDIIYVKDALKDYLLGVLFNMVPETRFELVDDEYTGFLEKNGVASYGVLESNSRLSAVSVGEIVEALGGTYRVR